jgi:RNA polymerase sigma factor (sigma-70 family)
MVIPDFLKGCLRQRLIPRILFSNLCVSKTNHPDEFVSALNRRSKRAYGALFKQFYQSLCFYVEIRLGDREAAQDIVADVFLKFWERKVQFQSFEHLQSVLYRAASNSLLDYLRTSQRSRERGLYFALEQGDQDNHHLATMVHAEVIREIREAIGNLPGKLGSVVKLAFLDGLDNNLIAIELGISEKTVRNLKSEALNMLRSHLSPDDFAWLLLLSVLFPPPC